MNLSKCVYCGTELTKITNCHKEYLGHKIITITNTPLVMCKSCMKEFIPDDIMSVINKILNDISNKSFDTDLITVDFNDYINNKVTW